jgi:hypothetical protein
MRLVGSMIAYRRVRMTADMSRRDQRRTYQLDHHRTRLVFALRLRFELQASVPHVC